MNEQASCFSIINARVRYDSGLSAQEKVLFAEITALTNREGYCWASNDYLAKIFVVDPRTIRRWLHNLKNRGHLRITLIYKENSKQVSLRKMCVLLDPPDADVRTPPDTDVRTPPDKNVRTPPDRDVLDNSISENNISKNKDSSCGNQESSQNCEADTLTASERRALRRAERNSAPQTEDMPLQAPPLPSGDTKVVLDHYNAHRGDMARCMKLGSKRTGQINARIAEVGLDRLLEIIAECCAYPFFQGDNNRKWKPDLEWLTKDSNFTKILEGKYENAGGEAEGYKSIFK